MVEQKTPDVSLADKYTSDGRVYLTGSQALVRLPLLQRRLDQAQGLHTACFISGYRGSPLGGYDIQLQQAAALLTENEVVFQPGVNEELAATALWGAQQAGLRDGARYDGVFGIWYGKGPGVDRSGDAFRHANLAGSARHGGVIALLGDDHSCESSTTCHQSEFAMVDAMMPVLNPAGVRELIEYGLHGWAMSRYSGCWVGIKCVHDTVSSTVSTDVSISHFAARTPDDFSVPDDGVNIRIGDMPREQEARLQRYKLPAAQAYWRANQLDRVALDSTQAKIGIVTTGKAYLDVRQALADLDIDERRAEALGLRLYKVGMVWPLEPVMAGTACADLDTVLVVEEKRDLIESQLKGMFYNAGNAPRIMGKADIEGRPLLRSILDLNSNLVAIALARTILSVVDDGQLRRRLDEIERLEARPEPETQLKRSFYFCPGCPHSSSTRLPEGSRGMAGIGCAWMSQFMDRNVDGYAQMGGEGATWIGEAPFSKTDHLFQTLGDGTYFHSGNLAIRASVAAGVNITYKILYNDAVAMTGGQAHDGVLTPWDISRQVHSEGVKAIALVSDEPDKYPAGVTWAPGVTLHHRRDLNQVQTRLRDIPGTTVLIYDQTCAAEKRRRRKRKRYPDPAKRLFINSAVCEACGDCGAASNCTAILPEQTPLGRKRRIDQSACNKDYSCANGFCPSFVTVLGGEMKTHRYHAPDDRMPPEPGRPSLQDGYNIVITGIGGTGIVTIGALLGMAAHLEGKGCAGLDMTGLAQKGGAVISHLRLHQSPAAISAVRIPCGGADLILGCDLLVSSGNEAMKTIRHGATRVLLNSEQVMTGEFTRDPDLYFPADEITRLMSDWAGNGQVELVAATDYALDYMGNTIAGNLVMVGYAYQRGMLPLKADSILAAIDVNGVAAAMNRQAFNVGRKLAAGLLEPGTKAEDATAPQFDTTDIEALVAHRAGLLTDYQDSAYAQRYKALVSRVRRRESDLGSGRGELSLAVAKYYYKLLAYKDEYEVARLYAHEDFSRALKETFSGDYELRVNLAPPLLSKRDKTTGHLIKREFGPWVLAAFRLLARFKALRGTPFDIFGYTDERKMERRLIAEYEQVMNDVLNKLSGDNYESAVRLAELPEQVRGFGHVKKRHVAEMKKRRARCLREVNTVNLPAGPGAEPGACDER